MKVYIAPDIADDSWLNEERFAAFRYAYYYAAAKTRAIPGLSRITPEQAYYVWALIARGFMFYEVDHELGTKSVVAEKEATIADLGSEVARLREACQAAEFELNVIIRQQEARGYTCGAPKRVLEQLRAALAQPEKETLK